MFKPLTTPKKKPQIARLAIPSEIMEEATRLAEEGNSKVADIFVQAIEYAFNSRKPEKTSKDARRKNA